MYKRLAHVLDTAICVARLLWDFAVASVVDGTGRKGNGNG